MHKSQGFGSAERRGSQRHYFVNVAGAPANDDLLNGIDTTWQRFGRSEVASRLKEIRHGLDPQHPYRSIPALLALQPLFGEHPRQLAELDQAIALSSGLWLDAAAADPLPVQGSDVTVRVTILNRSPHPWKSGRVHLPGVTIDIADPISRK